MRIGFDAKRLYANASGLGNYARTLVDNLVTYFPDHHYRLYTTARRPGIELPTSLTGAAVTERRVTHPLRAYWRTFGVVNELAADGLDVYHGLSHEIPLGLQRTRVRSVVTVHDLAQRTHPELYPWLDRRIYNWKLANAIRHADRIIAISENTRRDVERFYAVDPARIRVLYQACHPAYYAAAGATPFAEVRSRYGLPADYLLYVGSLTPRKNLETLLRALARLPQAERPPLVLVGRGETHRRTLAELARELGIAELLTFVTNLEATADLVAVYRAARAFVYPSVYEGFGIPVVEGLLSRVPVVTARNSALVEAGGPDTAYFAATDAEELAARLSAVLTDGDRRARMIERGHAYATARFGRRATAEALMAVYREVIA